MNFPSWLRSLGGFSTSSQTEKQSNSQDINLKRPRSPSSLSDERRSKQKQSNLDSEEENQSSKPWLHQLFQCVEFNSIQTSENDESTDLERSLPDGWTKEIDRLGRDFYVNQITNQTSFEFPQIEENDVKPNLSKSMKKTQLISKTPTIPLFLPDPDREESTRYDQNSQTRSPSLELSPTSESQDISQRTHINHISLDHLRNRSSSSRTLENDHIPQQSTNRNCHELPEEGKKKPKKPVTLDLVSDSSAEDIKPNLPSDNQILCNLKKTARQETHDNESHVDLCSNSISFHNEKTQSRPISLNQNSSQLKSESFDIDLEPYDEVEDQSIRIESNHRDLSTERHIQSHTLPHTNSLSLGHNNQLDQETEYIKAQQVNTDQDLTNVSLDEHTRLKTPSRTRNLSQSTSFSPDHDDLYQNEEMKQSESGSKEDHFLILTHLSEESSIEELIKFVKTGEDPKKKLKKIESESSNLKLPEPLKIWCDLNSRGYPKSLWDFVSKSNRNYIGEKFNHGNSNHRFIIIEYEFNFQKDAGYKFFKGGINGNEITFYLGSVMVHLLDDLNDLEGCDCIYDKNPEIITCKAVREKFKRLIKTLTLISEERKEKDLKPLWQKLSKEIIEGKFKKGLNDRDLIIEDFNEYLKEASRVGIVRMSKLVLGKDLNQVDLLGLGESIVHWQLMKPFRKSIENSSQNVQMKEY